MTWRGCVRRGWRGRTARRRRARQPTIFAAAPCAPAARMVSGAVKRLAAGDRRRRPARLRAPAALRCRSAPPRRPRWRRRSGGCRSGGAARRRRGWGTGRSPARRARACACRRSSAGRRCGAPRRGRPSARSSAATARGVRPSPHTLSRPCGPFSNTVTLTPARAARDGGGGAGRPAADDEEIAMLHALQPASVAARSPTSSPSCPHTTHR